MDSFFNFLHPWTEYKDEQFKDVDISFDFIKMLETTTVKGSESDTVIISAINRNELYENGTVFLFSYKVLSDGYSTTATMYENTNGDKKSYTEIVEDALEVYKLLLDKE